MATLCSQVSCLADICGMISFLDPEKPDQVYRLWTSLFLHGGLLHLIITIIFQYVVMRDLEKMAGPTRIAIIYIGSGLAGNLASGIFLPYQAEVGPSGSQFGLLACLFVEVFQSWPLLLHPWRALGKLLFILLFLFILGLLPWVDNYSHLFGFVFGFMLSFMVLPYVSVGKFDRRRKIITIVVCFLCFVGMFAMLFVLFYVTPIYECKGCSYFNCIPFTKHFCEDMKVEVVCEVTTAKPIDAEMQTEIEGALKAFLKEGETIQLTTKVDASIIGGMIVVIGDKYADMSLKTKINKYTSLIQQAV